MQKQYKPVHFPIILTMVKMANNKCYLFRYPEPWVQKGTRVVCKTQVGEQPGIVTDFAQINDQGSLDFVMRAAGVRRLEPVIGITHCDYLKDRATYYAGKGLEVPAEPVTTSTAKDGDPWITVHLPSGDVFTN